MNVSKDLTYILRIQEPTKNVLVEALGMNRVDVEVSSMGMNRVDAELQSYYSSVDELPEWAQSRLSVLSMLEVPPPLCDVAGVGARMGPYLYWLYT